MRLLTIIPFGIVGGVIGFALWDPQSHRARQLDDEASLDDLNMDVWDVTDQLTGSIAAR